MNDLLYNKNVDKFIERWPEYTGLFESHRDDEGGFCTVENIEGDLIPIVNKDGKAYRLASVGHNDHILDIWMGAVNMQAFELNMFMFGLGNGMYVRRLLEETAGNDMVRVIVYEPDIFIIKECFSHYDMTDILSDDRLELMIPVFPDKELSDHILHNISYNNINGVHSSCYINYPRIYEAEYRAYNEQISRSLDSIRANQHMMNVMGLMHYNNTLKNYKNLADSYSLDSLNKLLPKDMPVIIVSSGPSLTNNISSLKAAKGRSMICAVDSALGAMDAAGIIPDMYITVDPFKCKENFVFEWLNRIPVVASLTSPEYVYKEEGQKHFIVSPLDTYICELNENTRRYFKQWDIRSGGSVASSAFKFFQLMGCSRIILVGQDLAYTGNKSHADTVAYDDDDMSETLMYTVDVYGNKVLTSKTLEMYKDWFEKEIALNKWCKVVDATEGGAYIKGTEISTLSEAIDKYCVMEADVQQCLSKCDRLFEGELNVKFMDYIRAVPKRMDNIISIAKKLLHNYDRIELLVRESGETGGEMMHLLSENSKMTSEIEGDPAYCYIDYLNVDSNKEVENSINTVDNDFKKDILNICGLGRIHVEGIISASGKIRDDYTSVFDPE